MMRPGLDEDLELAFARRGGGCVAHRRILVSRTDGDGGLREPSGVRRRPRRMA
jgi:hypothetical protein